MKYCPHLKNPALLLGLTCLMAATVQAQFSPRNLAVLRAGDNSTNAWSVFGPRQSPAFIDEFSPTNPIVIASTNTGASGPVFSVSIPINDPASVPPYVAMWFDGHDATEGDLSQSADGSTLAFTGRILTLPPLSLGARVHPNDGCGGLRSRR